MLLIFTEVQENPGKFLIYSFSTDPAVGKSFYPDSSMFCVFLAFPSLAWPASLAVFFLNLNVVWRFAQCFSAGRRSRPDMLFFINPFPAPCSFPGGAGKAFFYRFRGVFF